jgi:hypothetical protein
VLIGDNLPELGTDLVTGLASLDVDEFALERIVTGSAEKRGRIQGRKRDRRETATEEWGAKVRKGATRWWRSADDYTTATL